MRPAQTPSLVVARPAARLEISERGDAIDAIATALNMLAEGLSVERSSRQRAEEPAQAERRIHIGMRGRLRGTASRPGL
jgi:hypothetical protein